MNGQRELLTSILEANLALLGVQQNEVVRAISAWAAIIAVPTFLASIWGMNFEHMPELAQEWGYPAALALMAVAVVVPLPLLQADRLALAAAVATLTREMGLLAHVGSGVFEPLQVAGVTAFGAAYAARAANLARAGRPVPAWRHRLLLRPASA